jgi:uncharacterized protein (TIGR02145 family)
MKHKTNTFTVSLLFMAVFICFAGSCKKMENDPMTVTDIDGNVYGVVKIGYQYWMLENLKTSRYNDGTSIPTGLSNAAWGAATNGAYSIYENDASNDTTYGKLYNWYAVNSGKLAPAGWHIPSDAEWTVLTDFLGGLAVAGGNMKSVAGWKVPNTGATNNSGFTGLPAGYRNYIGQFKDIGSYGFFWSSNEDDTDNAWHRDLRYNYSGAGKFSDYKEGGFSVRCVRD